MTENTIIKDRDIPIGDYITLMQYEYISYMVRTRLWSNPLDKDKFKDIAAKKKIKIEKITSKNSIPTIFSNEKIKDQMLDSFFTEWGLPKFKYRDDYQRHGKKGRNYWDRYYYYRVDRDVKVKTDEGISIGKIVAYDCDRDIVTINCKDLGIIEMESVYVSRILSTKFFEGLI